MNERHCLLGYRISLAVAALATLLPWVRVNKTALIQSIAGTMVAPSASGAKSILGLVTLLGFLVLLAAVGGLGLTFSRRFATLPTKAKYGMSVVGGLIAFLAIIGITTAASRFSKVDVGKTSFDVAYVAAATYGVYVALLGGLASGVLGFLAVWSSRTRP